MSKDRAVRFADMLHSRRMVLGTDVDPVPTRRRRYKATRRSRFGGTSMVEMPIALWIMVLLCFPLLILATEALRFGFFWNACREAAQQAAKCQTFQVNSSTGPSSVTVATQWAAKATQAFNGLTLNAVKVYIVTTDVTSQQSTASPNGQKLQAAADVTNNIYAIRVELDGQIDPLVSGFQGVFGPVPGLTGPFPVMVKSQYSAEVPQGLNQ